MLDLPRNLGGLEPQVCTLHGFKPAAPLHLSSGGWPPPRAMPRGSIIYSSIHARPGWCSELELGRMRSTEMRDPGPASRQLPNSGRGGGGVGETCTDDYKAEGKWPGVAVKINE